MKNLFSKFKRNPQQETKVVCNNLSIANDCSLVSEIKSCQSKLDVIELEMKALKQFDIDISACFMLLSNNEVYEMARYLTYGKGLIGREEVTTVLCRALRKIDLSKLFKELTALHDREIVLADKENEANELREKIAEAKNALGIK